MELFIVTLTYGGAEADYIPRQDLEDLMKRDWHIPGIDLQTQDRQVLAKIDASFVGAVIPWRLGWIFLSNGTRA